MLVANVTDQRQTGSLFQIKGQRQGRHDRAGIDPDRVRLELVDERVQTRRPPSAEPRDEPVVQTLEPGPVVPPEEVDQTRFPRGAVGVLPLPYFHYHLLNFLLEFQKFLIYLIQAIIKKLIKIQKKSENTNFTKPKKQSKLDILDFESSNNETLSMSTKMQILSSIKSSVYKFFLSLFASKANKNISNNYDIITDQFTIFTKQNILLAFTNLKSTKQLQKSLA